MTKEKRKKDFEGKMILFTAPSGAGKTTIVRHLLKTYEDLDFSISATTRKKRPHEEEGKDYYFISIENFREKVKKGEFVEWEEVYSNQLYGTLKSEIERLWAAEKHIIFDIDVRGASTIKKLYGDKCLAVFVKPPSLAVLTERLRNRKTESEASFRKRIQRVKRELTYENTFDKIIVNDLLEVALKDAELLTEGFLGIAEKEEEFKKENN